MASTRDKIVYVISRYLKENNSKDLLTRKEIVEILRRYNDLGEYRLREKDLKYFQTRDYCYNRYNLDLDGFPFKKEYGYGLVFEYKKNRKYIILGPDYKYTGPVYHEPRGEEEYVYGEWENGEFRKL